MKNTSLDIRRISRNIIIFPNWFSSILIFALFILITFLHSYKLDTVPLGLFFDESTIGIQASKIVQTGFDTYGGEIPIYFKSEADYDSPILIYATAATFKAFGISEYTLRLPNVFFFLIALIFGFWLISNLFNNNRTVQVYFLIAFGFLPKFFTISRLSFEVISQLSSVAGAFLLIWWTFHKEDSGYSGYIKAALSGLAIGFSTYTYSTASLLSALLMATVLAIYFSKKNVAKLAFIVSTCLLALIPYAIFSLNNPGALTSRFQQISFLYEATPITEKIKIFFTNYFSNWSLDFLILHGDSNLRHSTGLGGMIYISTFVLFILGIIGIFLEKKIDKFKVLLFLNLFFAPIASALTSEGNPHAVRTLLMGYFIVIISCYGIQILSAIQSKLAAVILTISLITFLGYEVYRYQFDYFFHYAARSVDAIGSYDFYGSLEFALEHDPKNIILFDNSPGIRDNFLFYSQIIQIPNNIPTQINPNAIPESGDCILYRRLSGAEEVLDKSPIPFELFNSRHRPSKTEKQYGEKIFYGVMQVRCYTGP